MLKKEQVFFHAFSGDLFIPLGLARTPTPGRRKSWDKSKRKTNPAADHVFLEANMLNTLQYRRIKPPSTLQRKASYHLTLLAQLHGAGCPSAESWWEKIPHHQFL